MLVCRLPGLARPIQPDQRTVNRAAHDGPVSVRRFEPAKETAAGHPPHQGEIVFGKYFSLVPVSARPIACRALQPCKVDGPTRQRRLRKCRNLTCKFAALTIEFFMPIRGL